MSRVNWYFEVDGITYNRFAYDDRTGLERAGYNAQPMAQIKEYDHEKSLCPICSPDTSPYAENGGDAFTMNWSLADNNHILMDGEKCLAEVSGF